MWDVMASAPLAGFLSRMTVERSARLVYRAQVQPAGPPPTMATSHSMTSIRRAVDDDDDDDAEGGGAALFRRRLSLRCWSVEAGVTKADAVRTLVVDERRASSNSDDAVIKRDIISVIFLSKDVVFNYCYCASPI
mmetsp:Transcript_52338/g.111223  ORF Transcript_52338/g.111223 Transcript_52338/m.111223 type:complete len:135 (-) Transcript_52338:216-620(-)